MAQVSPPRPRDTSLARMRMCLRWIGRHPDACSYVIWILATLAFARWTQTHFYAEHGAAWIGMTIRCATFAVLTLAAREWCALRWADSASSRRPPR